MNDKCRGVGVGDRLENIEVKEDTDFVRLNLTIGIDEELKMILDMDPGLIDPLPSHCTPSLSWSPLPTTPPTFKTATPSTRTHIKQLLMKEKALEDSRREQKLLEQQRLEQQQLQQSQQSVPEKKQYLRVPQNVGISVDVPPQVLQVKTQLENPTQYHVNQKRRMQLRQYLDDLTEQRRASLPTTQTASLPLQTQTQTPHKSSLPPQVPSLLVQSTQSQASLGHLRTPAFSHHSHSSLLNGSAGKSTSPGLCQRLQPPSTSCSAPSPSPDVPMSPGLSSVATSNSEITQTQQLYILMSSGLTTKPLMYTKQACESKADSDTPLLQRLTPPLPHHS